MKLYINRLLSNKIYLDALPAEFHPDAVPLISSASLALATTAYNLAAAKAIWPAPLTIDAIIDGVPTRPGIMIINSNGTIDTFSLITAVMGLGQSVAGTALSGGIRDVTSGFMQTWNSPIPGVIEILPPTPDDFKYIVGLKTNADSAYADSYINSTPIGNVDAPRVVTSKGLSPLAPYYQSSTFLPATTDRAFQNLSVIDTTAAALKLLPLDVWTQISGGFIDLTIAGHASLQLVLDVDPMLFQRASSVTTDSWLAIPFIRGGSESMLVKTGPDMLGCFNVDLLPGGPQFGAFGVTLIPFAALTAGTAVTQSLKLVSDGIKYVYAGGLGAQDATSGTAIASLSTLASDLLKPITYGNPPANFT